MAGDGGRVPDVSDQRAEDHVCYIENGRCQYPGCFRRGSADPASVLAALLAESPEATVAAIEALLMGEEAVRGAERSLVASARSFAIFAACRSLLSKAPKGDGDA